MMFDLDNFQLYEDTVSGQFALICPSPTVIFKNVDELTAWATDLIERAHRQKTTDEPLNQSYAERVIEKWQTLLAKDRLTDDGLLK